MAEVITKAFLVGGSKDRHGTVIDLRDPSKTRENLAPEGKTARTLEYRDTGRATTVWTADTGFVLCRVFVLYDMESFERGE